jgi:GDPmannose 4,6-dehydratase
MKKALICGISGQDGAYLSQLLLKKGYLVFGTSRDKHLTSFNNLKLLGVYDQVQLFSMSLNDFRSTIQVLKEVQPDEIYNLAGQSSVELSFDQPVETLESICIGSLNLLEAIRSLDIPVRLYSAGSGECFGSTGAVMVDENTPFRPLSPYAVAKAAAFLLVANYRKAYGLYACSGILFNHESSLRPERFVTRKIIATACRIAKGSVETLKLGNMDIKRDWGWAPEYVDAMWRMLQQDQPDDYIVATGQTSSLRDFVATAFDTLGLDVKEHVLSDPALYRPTDIMTVKVNPSKANDILGWEAKTVMPEVVHKMVQSELSRRSDHTNI